MNYRASLRVLRANHAHPVRLLSAGPQVFHYASCDVLETATRRLNPELGRQSLLQLLYQLLVKALVEFFKENTNIGFEWQNELPTALDLVLQRHLFSCQFLDLVLQLSHLAESAPVLVRILGEGL